MIIRLLFLVSVHCLLCKNVSSFSTFPVKRAGTRPLSLLIGDLYLSETDFVSALEIVATPVLLLLCKASFDKKLDEIESKYQNYQPLSSGESIESIKDSFTNDIKGAVEAYNNIYEELDRKVVNVGEDNAKRSIFEKDVLKALDGITTLASEVEIIKADYSSLKQDANSAISSIDITSREFEMKLKAVSNGVISNIESIKATNDAARVSILNRLTEEQSNTYNEVVAKLDVMSLRLNDLEVNIDQDIGDSDTSLHINDLQNQITMMFDRQGFTTTRLDNLGKKLSILNKTLAEGKDRPEYIEFLSDKLSNLQSDVSLYQREISQLDSINKNDLSRIQEQVNSLNTSLQSLDLRLKSSNLEAVSATMNKIEQNQSEAEYTVKKLLMDLGQINNELTVVTTVKEILPSIIQSVQSLQELTDSIKSAPETETSLFEAIRQSESDLKTLIDMQAFTTTNSLESLRSEVAVTKRDVNSVVEASQARQEKQNKAMLDVIDTLNQAIKSTSMDIDDTLEQIDDRQDRLSREIKSYVNDELAENNRQRAQAASAFESKLGVVESGIGELKQNLVTSDKKILEKITLVEQNVQDRIRSAKKSTLDSVDSMERLLTKRVELSSDRTIDKMLTLDSSIRGLVDKEVKQLSSSLKDELKTVSDVLTDKISLTAAEIDETDITVAALQRKIKDTSNELDETIRTMSDGIDDRVVKVIKEKSILSKIGRAAMKTTGYVGGKIKSIGGVITRGRKTVTSLFGNRNKLIVTKQKEEDEEKADEVVKGEEDQDISSEIYNTTISSS